MSPQIDIITLAVNGLEQAREFFEGAFGATASRDQDAPSVRLGPNASRLHLRGWNEVASDAGVLSHGRGFRAFTLSCILESAPDVDQVLGRAEQHGGRVSKPPKNAVWGYSAYVTDPNGYLWKIASSKRRPLLAREHSAASNGHVVEPQEVPITIGVADDAAVSPEGSGFRGFSMTHVVGTPDRVDDLLARAAAAGGTIVKPAAGADLGGYSGYFADLDGNLWQVASQT